MDAKTAAAKVQAGLQDLSDNELVEVYSALKGNDEYKTQFSKLMHQAGGRLKDILDEDEKKQVRGGAAKVTSDEEALVRDNLKQIEQLSKVDPLSADNKDFGTTRKYLGNLEVVDGKGKKVDLTPNIIEVAKLKTTADLYNSTQPLTQDVYNQHLRDNIDMGIYGIMMVNNLVKPSATRQSMTEVQNSLNSILSGQKQTVTATSASSIMGAQIVSLTNFASELSNKFKKLDLVSRFKTKVEEANINLTQKLKDTYVKARTYAQILAEQNVLADVGMAAVAGFGGPAGMAAFGAWTYYRRVHPLIKAYKEERQANPKMKNFWQYMGEHRKDTLLAGLYMGASVVSFGIAGAQVIPAITQSATAAQIGTAAVAPLVHAKMAMAAGVVAARGATDIAAEWNTENRGKAVKRALFSLGMFGVGYEVADYLAHSHHDTLDMPKGTPVATQPVATDNSVMLDNNHNGISDYIERPADEAAPIFKPLPWQEAPVADHSGVVASHAGTETVVSTGSVAAHHEYTVGTHEQMVYERNLHIVKDSDIMVANIKDGIVDLPKGMTPEMAVNLARVEYLYYGDDTGLLILKDCDEVSKISSLDYFNHVASKFTDSCQAPHGVGFPKDPNYGYTDPNIYTSEINVDCDKTTIIGGRTGGHIPAHPVTTPTTPVTTPIAPATPPAPATNLPPMEATPVSLRVDPAPLPTHINPVDVSQPAADAPNTLEQPVLKGVGGNVPLDENINSEASRLGTNIGVDGDGNVVRVDTPQNFSTDMSQDAGAVAGSAASKGTGSQSLGNFFLNKKFNTFDLGD